MPDETDDRQELFETAQHWCQSKGDAWDVLRELGEGGTARVFEIRTPTGLRALKLYSVDYSTGAIGITEEKRIEKQVSLQDHACPSLVRVFDGGRFENHLYVLMSRAEGSELEKVLREVPRDKIRSILDQVSKAAIYLRDNNHCHRDIKAANVFISDDFTQATLLDVSVMRDIYDPVGVGTDQAGQLPVVATARYSPPEYLFRLIEPGPDLWHALTVYQLGALLHDLIMREPLFQAEYLSSKSNRYRFAWIVATQEPTIEADDIDADLIFLARRALEKNWKKRSQISLEEFLADSQSQETIALELIGLGSTPHNTLSAHGDFSGHARLREAALTLKEKIRLRLKSLGVTPTHVLRPSDSDDTKSLLFSWTKQQSSSDREVTMEFEVQLQLLPTPEISQFSTTATLTGTIDGGTRNATMILPATKDDINVEELLADQVQLALRSLAVAVTKGKSSNGG